jgi:hypothetical protein
MSNLRTAAQQALEALWFANAQHWFGSQTIENAIASLQAVLEQPEQEPVAWMVYTEDGKSVCVTDSPADFTDEHKALPLYATPPRREWRGLTNEEIRRMGNETPGQQGGWNLTFARAIEAKLKERNA